jgi:hypothetical protein
LKKTPSPSNAGLLSRFLLGATLALSLAACGGGSEQPSSAAPITSAQGPSLLAATATGGSWVDCSVKGGQCSFTGTQQVRYGANGTYFYRSVNGSVPCTDQAFGDPLPGVDKACSYYSVTASPAPAPAPTAAPTPTTALQIGDPKLGSCAGFKQVPPIQINGQSNVVIDDVCVLNAPGNCVEISNSTNVTIKNSKFGSCGKGVVYAVDSHGVKVENNTLYNPHFTGGQGQYVQFNNVTGGGSRIRFNRGYSIAGQSNTEDGINMYKSAGVAGDPIMIYGNKIDGGGPSNSGGGILLGDDGGSHQCAVNNIVINPGQYGMSIVGGNHNMIKNNKILAKQQPFTNVGLYIWNQYAPACDSNKVENNKVSWINKSGTQNPSWNAGNCTATSWVNNAADSTLSETALRNETIPAYDEASIKTACQ